MNRKRILLISSDFFNYYKLITAELENQGWDVVYLNDRPSSNALMKIMIRKFRFLISWYLDYFYSKKLQDFGIFDHVLIVKGEGITPKTINRIRENHTPGKIYNYHFDSMYNFKYGFENSKHVDQVFTFDPVDAKKYHFKLLPLFYKQSEDKAVATLDSETWDLSFIGSQHGDRLKVLSKIRQSLPKQTRFFIFIFFPSRLSYFFSRVFDRSFRFFSQDELSLESIDKSKTKNIFNNSVASVDIHHQGQSGLTMRTLEVLSLGKKLITTNETIKSFSFYDENQILVIDRNHPVIDQKFFSKTLDVNFTQKIKTYEISQWVKAVTTGSGQLL